MPNKTRFVEEIEATVMRCLVPRCGRRAKVKVSTTRSGGYYWNPETGKVEERGNRTSVAFFCSRHRPGPQ